MVSSGVCVRACVVYAGEEVKGGEWNKSLFVFLQYSARFGTESSTKQNYFTTLNIFL